MKYDEMSDRLDLLEQAANGDMGNTTRLTNLILCLIARMLLRKLL